MESRLLTVAQYARSENVSRQAIYQRMRNVNWRDKHCKELHGQIYIDVNSFDRSDVQGQSENDKEVVNQFDREIDNLTRKIEALERENELLRNQLEQKDTQIIGLIAGWQEAQRIGAMKQLSEPESEPEEQKLQQEPEEQSQPPEKERNLFHRLFWRR